MSRKILSETEVRRSVEKILKRPVTDAAWQIARTQRLVSEVQQGLEAIKFLAETVQKYMDIIGLQTGAPPQFTAPKRRQRRDKIVLGRQEAISESLAEIARQTEAVLSFRAKILGGRLIKFGDVEQWIKDRASDSAYPNALLVRVKRDTKLYGRAGRQSKRPLSLVNSDEIEGFAPTDSLHYAKPDSSSIHCFPVGRDGTLRAVYQLSNWLASTFRWQAAEATVFLLTDIPPLVRTESLEFIPPPFITPPYEVRSPNAEDPRKAASSRIDLAPLDCLARVSIMIDPIVNPQELKEKYAELRAKLLSRKPRSQNQKHLTLAVFSIKHPALDKAAMTEWWRLFPKWKYDRVSLFARDARDARDRLLHYYSGDFWSRLAKKT